MPRKFLDTVRSFINGNIVSNTQGNISGDEVNQGFIDSIDSLVPDEGRLSKSAPTAGLALTTTWISLDGNYFDTAEGDDGDFLNVDATTGVITGTSTLGFSYSVLALITLSAPGNATIEASIGLNGVPSGFTRTITISGGAAVSGNLRFFSRSTPSNAQFTLMLRVPSASETVTVEEVELIAVILPTNNP